MQPNTLLDALLDEAGMSHAGLAAHVNQAGRARGLRAALRTHRRRPVAEGPASARPGARPDLRGARARRLHRPVTLDDIGLGVPGEPRRAARHPPLRLRGARHRPVALRRAAAPAHPRRARRHRHAGRDAGVGVGEPARGRRRLARRPAPGRARRHRDAARRPRPLRADVPQGRRRRDPRPRSSASSTPRPRRCCAAATPTPPAGNCTVRRAAWSRSPGSAPTTPTRTDSPSATSTRRCGWRRPAGTGASART